MEHFQAHLIAEIAAQPDAAYYDCWVAALERLLVERRIASADEIAQGALGRGTVALPHDARCRRLVSSSRRGAKRSVRTGPRMDVTTIRTSTRASMAPSRSTTCCSSCSAMGRGD